MTTLSRSTTKDQLQKVLQQRYKEEIPLDVSKYSVVRLRQWAITSLHNKRLDSTCNGQELLKQEIYWDGYIRAIEHILEMHDQ